MKRILLIITGVVLSTICAAESPTESDFLGPRLGTLELIPQVSVFNPSQLVLQSASHQSSYADKIDGFSTPSLALAGFIGNLGNLQLYGVGRVGVSYKDRIHPETTRNGQFANETTSLIWAPLSLGLKLQYASSLAAIIKPSLLVNGGTHWLHETSETMGTRESYWIPFYSLGLAVTFFDKGYSRRDWFGGFSFGVGYESEFRSVQTFRGWSCDLSLNIVL